MNSSSYGTHPYFYIYKSYVCKKVKKCLGLVLNCHLVFQLKPSRSSFRIKTSICDRNADITLLRAVLTAIVTKSIYSGTVLNKICELTIATPASHSRYAASKIR